MSALRLPLNGLHHLHDEHHPRRRLSPAMTAGIGLSILVHAVIVAYLYQQRFELRTPETSGPDRPPIVLWRPPPPPEVKPVQRDRPTPPQAPKISARPPVAPTQPVPTAPFEPTPGPTVATTEPPVLTTADPGPVIQPPAETKPSGPPVIVRPNWISRPTGDQVARVYPPRALEREQGGRAVLQCSVTVSGQVAACQVVGETPAGLGFGAAALKLARYFA